MLLHASCAARGADAVLFLGPPGSGKSDLVLRLLGLGWALVADDQVRLDAAGITAPPGLLGRLEVRGLGIFADLRCAVPPLIPRLAVECLAPGVTPPRLPGPRCWSQGGMSLPSLSLCALEASATAKVEWALDTVLGLRTQQVGAFAP